MCGVVVWLAAQPLAAQEATKLEPRTGLSPTYFWFTASAALLSAGLGGLSAVRVSALYSQSQTILPFSPTQLSLKHKAEVAETTADCLFASAVAFGIASVWLAFLTDWRDGLPRENVEQRTTQFRPIATPTVAGFQLTGTLP